MHESENPINQEGSRREELKRELMQIERQVMKLKIHPTATSTQEIEDLHSKQVELLAELQNLEDTK